MMDEFREKLSELIKKSVGNNYTDNHDSIRFPNTVFNRPTLKARLVLFLRKNFYGLMNRIKPLILFSEEELSGFVFLYNKLGDRDSKDLLLKIVAYRLLGSQKVKLPLSNAEYWEKLRQIDSKVNKTDFIDPHFLNFKLYKHNLKDYDLQLYFTAKGILTDFYLEQYKYQSKSKKIAVEEGDTVIDAGGCWGDTALYFASKAGQNGNVFTFEFIPSNIKIFNKNLELNPTLKPHIHLIEHPVWEKSNLDTYYIDQGPASRVSFNKILETDQLVKTKSIDDLVVERNIQKIDFIKMDIEGAEPYALKGAIETIKKFKPVLAIAIYHSVDDFINIPKWIDSLNLGYEFYLGHYTIHSEETILFAKIN